MIVLALDQSSNITGYAIFENENLITYGKFNAGDKPLPERLVLIRTAIENLIKQYNVTKVIYEDIQLQQNVVNNVVTYKALAEVIGVITELLTELDIPFESVLASSWKSKLGIKGVNRAAQKKNAQNYVIEKYQKKPTQDECDAICIGLYHSLENSSPWPK